MENAVDCFAGGSVAQLVEHRTFNAVAERSSRSRPTTTAVAVPLSKGLSVLVDEGDYPRVRQFKWTAAWINCTWYAVRSEGRTPNDPSGQATMRKVKTQKGHYGGYLNCGTLIDII